MSNIIFTDGSTLNNQDKNKRVGGIGVFYGDNDERNISEILIENPTNQKAELLACIRALENCDKKNIIIYTDSKYVIGCMTEWLDNWKNNNWKNSKGKTIKNLELIKNLDVLCQNNIVKFIHVKAHQKMPNKNTENYKLWYGNKMADKLATDAAKSYTSPSKFY